MQLLVCLGKSIVDNGKGLREVRATENKKSNNKLNFKLMENNQRSSSNPHLAKPVLCPVLGQTYNYFDDGKIRESRRMAVVITEIIPFSEIDEETLNDWKEEVEECDWLYAKETDYFVKADLKVSDDKVEKIIFVRTINNNDGWFSLGWWGGRLDIDGSLNALLNGA